MRVRVYEWQGPARDAPSVHDGQALEELAWKEHPAGSFAVGPVVYLRVEDDDDHTTLFRLVDDTDPEFK